MENPTNNKPASRINLFIDDDVNSTTKNTYLCQWENSNIETLLKQWGEKTGGLRWMNRHSASYWKTIDKRLNLVSIGISSFISASSLLGAAESIVDPTYIMITVGFVGMLSILNQSLMRYYNAPGKITLHETAAQAFGNLNRLIAVKLSMSRNQRGDPKEFVEYVMEKHERLFNSHIEPHSSSIQAFKDEFENIGDGDFAYPDILSKTFRIDVYDKNDYTANSGSNKFTIGKSTFKSKSYFNRLPPRNRTKDNLLYENEDCINTADPTILTSGTEV